MAVKHKPGSEWTPAQLRRMREIARSGKSARYAARVLGSSRGAVAFKAMNEGIRFQSVRQPRGVQKRIHRRRRAA